MSQSVVPLMPGCGEGMSGLQRCYDDLNNASAFIAQLMIDLINNNPAVTQAIIDAIEKNGSALPLLGVTNGTPAVAPQVGQYIQLSGTMAYTATTTSALLSLGVLPAGDWDCWLWSSFTSAVQGASVSLNPLPAGFAANPSWALVYGVTPPNYMPFSMTVEALTTIDSLIVADTSVAATSGQSGTITVNFAARRRR